MDRSLRDQAVIVGIGKTDFSKNSGVSEIALASECVKNAIDAAGLKPSDIDGMTSFTLDTNDEVDVARNVGCGDMTFFSRVGYGGGAAVSIVHQAAMAVATGSANYVVGWRALNGRSGQRCGRADGALSVGGDRQFSGPHGYLTPPQWLALWAQKHQDVYGSTCEDLGQIAIGGHQFPSVEDGHARRD